MPINDMVISAMIMGKIRFTKLQNDEKIWHGKNITPALPSAWHKFIMHLL